MTSRLLVLKPPFSGLSVIVNVTNKVGPGEANNSEDVKVVQQLTQMAGKGQIFSTNIGLPQASGHFDAATGFWIYHLQAKMKQYGHANQIVDGIVSPAHGATYAAGAAWTIVLFNFYAQKHAPTDYAAFVAQFGAAHAVGH